jgi:hypothetical protein
VLIGIDMLVVQSPEGRDREAGRLGRQLVSALLGLDPAHRYVLYTHQGYPTDRVPSAVNAGRVSLAPIPGGSSRLRPTIQRVLDQNPDGLDWLLLLDPFEPGYGGIPPEGPLNDLKVASLILDLAPTFADDRRLAPLRHHDAILAVSESTASDCRRRLGSASWRVSTLGVACDASFEAPDASEPPARAEAEELGGLGITGPFLFARLSGGADRSNLGGILDAYRRLPIGHRERHQLAIAGAIDDPWGVVGYLHERGCAEGLVLVGEVGEGALQTLYSRCSAFVSPSVDEGPGLSLVEAMRCGAPVLAGRAGSQPEIVGDAGLLVDPSDPAEIAGQIERLLSDADLDRDLRKRARGRASRFSWGPVVGSLLATLEGDGSGSSQARIRVDHAHLVRPRIAIFPDVPRHESALDDLLARVPAVWRASYQIDFYLEPNNSALVDQIPTEFGGFDARQFGRNDSILSYHAVVYDFGDLEALESKLGRLRSRPGLVFLRDRDPIDPQLVDAERAEGRLREVFLTTSRLVVECPGLMDWIGASMPEFEGQWVEVPTRLPDEVLLTSELERCAAELRRGPGRRPRSPAVEPRRVPSPRSFRPGLARGGAVTGTR